MQRALRLSAEILLLPRKERVLTDLAGVVEVLRRQLEQVTSSVRMLEEQLNLLGTGVSHYQEGTRGHEKEAES